MFFLENAITNMKSKLVFIIFLNLVCTVIVTKMTVQKPLKGESYKDAQEVDRDINCNNSVLN